jgi:hypothetical protein
MEFYSAMKKNEILSFTSKWGRNEPNNVCTYECMNKEKIK